MDNGVAAAPRSLGIDRKDGDGVRAFLAITQGAARKGTRCKKARRRTEPAPIGPGGL